MERKSRRQFIKQTSVVAAAVGAATTVPASAAAALTRGGEDMTPIPDDVSVDVPVVAHVRNLREGEVALYTGERQVNVIDQRLASLLYHASR
jgi:hypothetical protein